MFGNFEKKTGVKMDDIMKLAQSFQNTNFKDEKQVRTMIKKVSSLAGKPVSREKEEMLVKAITSGKVPKDMNEIQKMMNKKK
ncbi:stage VI sporulation protein F [Rossellomorea vietnamensis]|jgi:predicted transcriptional regulator|uniref:Stage VI sporulation protein F n=2 Tax=Rossellomorea TaxID=2837508 RepID=A0A5D4NJ17_9BACI|nr:MULTISPECIES: stage VI sporulation protein F [Rossellomorea]TYR75144.1 stage VI sporulation protein F [Rossellomorea vietnamensis]TYS13521.1 stage VI sporulation protein F [Rossellomorea vietnamensis]TYS79901.1 stage VI sporulation protein F [Rossellomorea aquimaris]